MPLGDAADSALVAHEATMNANRRSDRWKLGIEQKGLEVRTGRIAWNPGKLLLAGVLLVAALAHEPASQADPAAVTAASPAQEILVAGRHIPIVRTCDADQYDCSLTLEPGGPSAIYWGWRDDKDHYRIDVTPSAMTLTRVLQGQAVRLSSASGAFASKDKPLPILLRRRTHVLYVVVGGRIVLDSMDSTFGAGPIAGERLKSGTFQPTDDIYFADDFMRTEKQQELGEWTKVSGTWRFHSVKETNPSADIRLSTNPFSLGGEDAEGGIVTAGFPFWSDYEFTVSVKSSGAFTGAVFSYKGPKDYFVLRLDLHSVRPSPSAVELVRVSGGVEKVLASGLVRAVMGDWYRLGVRVNGARIQALLDGDTIFDVVDPASSGGPVGLYTRGEHESVFDDVKVESSGVFPFDRAITLRRSGRPVSGAWKTQAAANAEGSGSNGPVVLVEKGGDASRYLLGDAGWDKGVIETRIRPEGNSGWAGLFFSYHDDDNWYLARWPVVKDGSGAAPQSFQVIRCLAGARQVVAEAPGSLTGDQWHDLQIDATPPGAVHFSLDGSLRLRLPMPVLARGSAGLYTLGVKQTMFDSPTLRPSREMHLEQQIANEVYKNDRFMQSWSSAKGQWFPATVAADLLKRWGLTPGSAGVAYWNKGDFFDAYTITLPLQTGLVMVFNSDREDYKGGYSLSIEPGGPAATQICLRRQDQLLKTRTLANADAVGNIDLHHSGDVIWVMQGDKELFNFSDRHSLNGLQVGLITPPTPVEKRTAASSAAPVEFDLASVQVERENIADYPFEEANCDWEEYGTWVVTNRFSCTPTWSHMSADGDRACVLLNKYAYEGDLTLEYYAGMKMGPNPAMYYPRVGDLNATISASGRDLSTGYSYLVGAWDPGWTEKWTRLLRGDTTAVETDRYTVPRDREIPGAREIAVPWIAAGRDIHGAWYYMKICRRGNHIDCYFDNEKVLSYDDAHPLDGRFLAIWTQMDRIVVARVRVTYQKRIVPHRLLAPAILGDAVKERSPSATRLVQAPPPQAGETTSGKAVSDSNSAVPVLTSSTHPGLFENFDRPGSEWQGTSIPRDVAVERVPGGPSGKGAYLRITNYSPGGDLGVKVPVPVGLDASRALLDFDYCFPPEAKVNLYVTIAGKVYFIRMTGGGDDHPLMPLLGDLTLQADAKWHHASFDLAASAVHLLPTTARASGTPHSPLSITEIRLGYFHEGYLRAGIGGNGPSAWYGLDNFAIATESAEAPVLAWAPPSPGAPSPAAVTPTAVALSPVLKGSILKVRVLSAQAVKLAPALRAIPALVKPEVTQTASAVQPTIAFASDFAFACDHSPDTEPAVAHPIRETGRTLGAEIHAEAPGTVSATWFAHVRWLEPGGTWSATAHLPFRITSNPLTLQLAHGLADGHWGGAPLDLAVEPVWGPPLDPSRLAVTVNGKALDKPDQVAAYDAPSGHLTLDLQRSGLTFADKEPVKITVQAASVDGPTSDNKFELVMDYARYTRAPHAPVVNSGGVSEGFEGDTGTWTSGAALAVRDTSTAANGKASLQIVNPDLASSFSVTALGQPFNVGHLPLLRFDYRVPDTVCSNWDVTTAQGPVGIGFTSPSDVYPVYGKIPDVKRDDQWHSGEVNLRAALDQMQFAPNQYDATSLGLGIRGYSGAKPGAHYWIDNFQLVPAVSGAVGITVSWSAVDCCGIKAYRYKWSAKPDDTTDQVLPGTVTSYAFKDIPEGRMYLNLQAQDNAGNWGAVSHTPFLVDNTPPTMGAPPSAPAKLGSSFWTLSIADAGPSGIDPSSLQVSVNGKPYPIAEYTATYDSALKTLSWEWPLGTGLFSGPVPDGQPVEFTVGSVKDFAGNTTPGATFKYIVDRASDKEPPRAPSMQAPGVQRVCLDDFTRGDLDEWKAYSGGPLPERVLDPEHQDYCLSLSTSGTYGYYTRTTTFDAVKTPWVAFDYRCPPGAGIYFMVYSGTWYVVPLSGHYAGYRNLEAVPGFKADGKWHSIAFNLLDRLRSAGIATPAVPVTYLAIWHYGSGAGLNYDIDNYQIFGAGTPGGTVSWQAADATGIEGYRVRIDQDPEAGMDGGKESTDRQVALTGLKPGPWFIRVRARDGAGNWSAPGLLGVAVE